MYKFLRTYKWSKLSQEEIEEYSFISVNEIDFCNVKPSPLEKSRPSGEFYYVFQEKIISITPIQH